MQRYRSEAELTGAAQEMAAGQVPQAFELRIHEDAPGEVGQAFHQCFVEVQQHVRHRRPRGEFDRSICVLGGSGPSGLVARWTALSFALAYSACAVVAADACSTSACAAMRATHRRKPNRALSAVVVPAWAMRRAQRLGRFHINRIVQRHQRLQRRVGARTANRTRVQGFLKPEDICKVDYDGKQLAGVKKRTSEVLLHLAVTLSQAGRDGRRPLPPALRHRLRRRSGADPQMRPAGGGGLPRRGAHRGDETPGTQKFADCVLPYVRDCNTIILANHGTVTFGPDLEKAYFNTEIIDGALLAGLYHLVFSVRYIADQGSAQPGRPGGDPPAPAEDRRLSAAWADVRAVCVGDRRRSSFTCLQNRSGGMACRSISARRRPPRSCSASWD